MEEQHKRAPLTEEQQKEKIVRSFFQNGRLASIPVKAGKREVILAYVANKYFEKERTYTEQEVNAILLGIYDDPFTLRRELIEAGLMARKSDGSAYWKN